MRLFGLEITRTKAAVAPLASAEWNAGAWFRIRESFAGAWQRGVVFDNSSILKQSTVWACLTLIMQDIGKLEPRLVERHGDIWEPVENPAYTPVLRKPNHYQNRIKFYEGWIASKLTQGNTYVLKRRDRRGVVDAMYLLDPERVKVLVAPDGSVYYQLGADNLVGIGAAVMVPAREIIHDVGVALYHPLCGLPPLVACALSASQSLSIQQSSLKFFQNHSKPGGVLTAPNRISQETADRIKAHWEANFAGEDSIGKVAVLGDGLKYEPMAVTAVDAQLAKQLAWTDEKICSVYHVPPFMVGVGPQPTYDNIEKFTLQYYQQALQNPIECIELCLDEGLELGSTLGIEFDIEGGLFRMDSATKMKNATEGVKGGVVSPNEARRKFNLPGVSGGSTPYLQQQNYSLAALAKRDAQADPFGRTPAAAPAAPPGGGGGDDDSDESVDAIRSAALLHLKSKACAMRDRYRKEAA